MLMKYFSQIGIFAMCLVLMSSCATIFTGGNPNVTIYGDTPEPVTIVTEVKTYKDVYLPCKVEVKRHKIDGQHIRVVQSGKRYRDIILDKAVNGWAYGNILIGGLIGWGVDLITNCVSKPATSNFYIEEKGKVE